MKYDKIRRCSVEGQILLIYTQAVRILFNNSICEKLLKRKTRFEKNGFAFRKLKLTACIFSGLYLI